MRQLSLVLALGLAVVGCGGGAGSPDDAAAVDAELADARVPDATPPDAIPPDAIPPDAIPPDAEPGLACNPVEQTGCEANQKCTWITVVASTPTEPSIGMIGCVPDGTATVGTACVQGAPGETTGYDNCAAGGLCIRNVCNEICTDVPDSCDTAVASCARYNGIFTDSVPQLGACAFKCDPVDQIRLFDGADRCGSPDGDVPTLACYGYVDVDFACTPAISTTNTHYVDVSASVTLNACAPGYGLLPLGLAPPLEDAFMCAAYCRPQPTHSAQPDLANGGGGFACAERGAAAPANECRYWNWIDVVLGAAGTPNPDNADHGICVRYGDHAYDHDADFNTPNVPFASCTTLTLADGPDLGDIPDAEEWGCVPPTAAAQAAGFAPAVRRKLGIDAPAAISPRVAP